ncbi:ATP-binding protein [Acidisoma sp. S159]|uniref:ATP-binding protein n=1 Tax=Acidisoma sp. S159 TaxID=1747225 RepID=UPI00131C5E36|nr:ATP-binding protein [Acidisoma sp. S159]
MAKTIILIGRKGGSGKTTLAHAIGHGLGSLHTPISALVVTTEADSEVPKQGSRRYLSVDDRSGASLQAVLEKAFDHEKLVVIIDGAARRPGADAAAADLADLILIPFTASRQDVGLALMDLERFPQAYAVPNRWPTHPGTKERAARLLNAIPHDRRMPLVPAIPKLADICDHELYPQLVSEFAAPCRTLAVEALTRMNLSVQDFMDS